MAMKPLKRSGRTDAKEIWDNNARRPAKSPAPKAEAAPKKAGGFTEKLNKSPSSPKKMSRPGPSVTFDKPQAANSNTFSNAQKKAASLRAKPAAPKAPPGPSAASKAGSKASQAAAKAASVGGRAAAVGSRVMKVLSTGSKLLGRANPVLSQITSAKPLNTGEQDWMKNKGPLMPGNKKYDQPIGPKKGNPNLGYGTFNAPAASNPGSGPRRGYQTPSMPAATGSESAGGSGPRRGYQTPSAAPATTTGDPKFSKGSAKNPGAGTANMTGTTEKRGAVSTLRTGGLQSKTQRDGLAMDQRKRK